MNQPEVMGRFGAAHGVRGWLRVHSYTEQPENLFAFVDHWQYQKKGTWVTVPVLEWRAHRQGFLCQLEGVETREEAQIWVGQTIHVLPTHLPTLPNNEYYWRDLTGCQVSTSAGYKLGVVSHLMETGANDVLVVKANTRDAFGIRERLLPFLPNQVIKAVDVQQKSIVVDWDPSF